jgi:TRAP-type uncharacterized transport system substrate-binding protein
MKTMQVTRLAMLAASVALALPASAQQVTMMTGPQGGSWVPLGGALRTCGRRRSPGCR